MKKLCYLLMILCCISVTDLDAAKKKAKHVVMIGIDGWAAKAVREAAPEDIPNITYLMQHGNQLGLDVQRAAYRNARIR